MLNCFQKLAICSSDQMDAKYYCTTGLKRIYKSTEETYGEAMTWNLELSPIPLIVKIILGEA